MSRTIDPNSAEVARIFAGIEQSWFRLATRQHYEIPAERERVAEFLRTGRVDASADRFVRLIERHAAARRVLRRVLVVHEPLSDYARFALAAAAACAAAGEDVRVLPVRPGALPGNWAESDDFWLFDDAQLWTMEHDERGRLVGVSHSAEPTDLALARRVRDAALAVSVPLPDYVGADHR
ncbi:DUF6879 family protein [Nocardia nova]|uniref:DUF6879 family protein n=1 Tax=Nocardia nova TaxID=37330 RepID=UPI00379D92D0